MKSSILFFAVIVLSTLNSFAQGPSPSREVAQFSAGEVQQEAQRVMGACRMYYEGLLKKRGAKPAAVTKVSRDVCFCIAKDLKRREDVDEMKLVVRSFKNQLADDMVLDDADSMYLHTLNVTEANCRQNSKYRFGDAEPTFSEKKSQKSTGAKDEKARRAQKND